MIKHLSVFILFLGIPTFTYGELAHTEPILVADKDSGKILVKTFYYDSNENGLLPWFESMEYCQMNNLEPGRIESAQENQVVANLLNNQFQTSRVFWLGATDWGQDGQFYWIRTGQNVGYNNFAPSYPNGGPAESCAYVWGDGLWYDQYCSVGDVRPLCQQVTFA